VKRQPWGLYAIALAILVVGLIALGVPASTLLVAALVLTCPLMMLFMMHGMHGMQGDRQHGAVRRVRGQLLPPAHPPGLAGDERLHRVPRGAKWRGESVPATAPSVRSPALRSTG
jgi:hypothetical protein